MATDPKPKAKESAADRFRRLGSTRVAKALKAIRMVGNLGAPGYEYTPEQAAKVVNALTQEVAAVKRAFEQPTRKTKVESFDL